MTKRQDEIATIAIVIISTTFIVALVVLILDLSFDIIDDDASSTLAGFLAGLVAILAYGVGRWLTQDDDETDD